MRSIGKKKAIVLAVMGMAFGAGGRVWGTTFYVSERAGVGEGRDGSVGRPWKTIGEAVAHVAAGDVLVVGTGVYRESVTIRTKGTEAAPVRIEAAPGATVVVTGADVLTGWRREEGGGGEVFSVPWEHVFMGWSPTRTHPGDAYHRVIGRAEQVVVGGLMLRQVLKREELARGAFFVDEAGKRLYVCCPSGEDLTAGGEEAPVVEAAARSVVWNCEGDFVVTKGLRFRYAANRAQEGAAVFSGKHDGVEDCVFERTNGVGATFLGEDETVRGCAFVENGQMGFGATRAHRLLVSGCTVRGNNAKGFDRGWEAGGDKIVLTRGAILENSTFCENHGSGVWFDMGNEGCVVRNCLIADNEDAGIFDEISYGMEARDNVVMGNGLRDTKGSWGAGGGICLSSSPGSVVERNILVGNREGLSLREQRRTTPRIDAKAGAAEEPVWNHDEVFGHNVVGMNRDAQVRGWFDMDDERHWPARMQEGKGRALSLETLKFSFARNFYVEEGFGGGTLFQWGAAWKRNVAYRSMEAVRGALGLEEGSVVGKVEFADVAGKDLRVRGDGEVMKEGCYPVGDVPGVRLGERER